MKNAYGDLREPEKKVKNLEVALEIFRDAGEDQRFNVAKTFLNLGNAYGDLYDFNKQEKYLKEALRINRSLYDPKHIEIAKTLTNLGEAFTDLGHAKEGKDYLEEALQIKREHYNRKDNYEVAITLVNLSKACNALGEFESSISHLNCAIPILISYYGEKHAHVEEALRYKKTAETKGAFYAFASGYHPRLGQSSPVLFLPNASFIRAICKQLICLPQPETAVEVPPQQVVAPQP